MRSWLGKYPLRLISVKIYILGQSEWSTGLLHFDINRQERFAATQEFVAGWRVRHQLPDPAGSEFHLPHAGQGPDRQLLLLPSLAFHKAAGGFGAIRIHSRPLIPVPFPSPADEFTVLIGDWYTTSHKVWLDDEVSYCYWPTSRFLDA